MNLKFLNHLNLELSELLSIYASAYGFEKHHPFQIKLTQTLNAQSFNISNWLDYIDELAEITVNQTVGLDIGQLAEPNHLGILGYLLKSSENVAAAGMQFGRYQKLVYGTTAKIFLDNQSYKIMWPLNKIDHRHSDECFLSAFAKITNSLTGKKLMPLEIGFRQAKPAYANRYEEIFGANIKFNCKQYYISYPLHYLGFKIKSQDQNIQKVLQLQAKILLSEFSKQDEFEQKLNTTMMSLIHLGKANLETVSRSLNTSTRTLQRQLKQRDTSFNKLLKRYKQELSKQYIKDKNLSLTDISFLLGYAEQSIFTRTFKSWYGITPKEYRNQLYKKGRENPALENCIQF